MAVDAAVEPGRWERVLVTVSFRTASAMERDLKEKTMKVGAGGIAQ